MGMNFNDAEEQRERKYGPVPSGSKVLLTVKVVKPSTACPEDPWIAMSRRTSLYGLNLEFTVAQGDYEGVSWREWWTLESKYQAIKVTDGQVKAGKITASKIRAMLEANAGVMPSDKSPRANNARNINGWLDLNGLTFPARLGLDDGRESNGKVYWNNRVVIVITPDKPDYQPVLDGHELITDGPTQGELPTGQANNGGYNGGGYGSEARGYDEPDMGPQPPVDDVPF